MFKHEIEYTDFNGTERKEDFYFHLSVVEVTRLQAEIGKDIQEYIKEITANQDLKVLLAFLEKMILSSYGRKTSDGKSFYKSQAIREEFEYSQAYAELFEQLLTNQELTRKFATGVTDNTKGKKNQVPPQVINQ